ncbi:calcium calmodulin-dependent protein kinase type 1G [Rhizophlyctis rosea]|nr:calcium calmodulin-dependent protein kinase type 1G [Rhizophlyctis rosea]
METFPDHDGVRDAKTLAEVDVLKELSSKYPSRVVKYLDFYSNEEDQLVLVMERAQCTVQDILLERRKLVEPDAKDVIFGMLDALHCIHAESYVHRDIKPGNLLLMDKADLSSVKISDFGTTVGNIGYSNLNQQAGTLHYMAPEMLAKSNYGKAVDLWSAGVTAYEILFGDVPFRATQKNASYKNQLAAIKKGKLEFKGAIVSEGAKSFLRGLLEIEPAKRLTVEQALDHPWLAAVQAASAPPPALPPRAPPTLPPRASEGRSSEEGTRQLQVPHRKESLENIIGETAQPSEPRRSRDSTRPSVRFDETPVVIGVHEEEEEGPVLESLPGHPGWFLVTQDDGMVYFYNEKTEESSWDPPDAVAGGPGPAEFVNRELKGTEGKGRGGGLVGFSPRSSSLPDPPSLEGSEDADWGTAVEGYPDWRLIVSPQGEEYYYNTATKETSWDAPGASKINVDTAVSKTTEGSRPSTTSGKSPLSKMRIVDVKPSAYPQAAFPPRTDASLNPPPDSSSSLPPLNALSSLAEQLQQQQSQPASKHAPPAPRPKPTACRAAKILPPTPPTTPAPSSAQYTAQSWKSMLKSVAGKASKVLTTSSAATTTTQQTPSSSASSTTSSNRSSIDDLPKRNVSAPSADVPSTTPTPPKRVSTSHFGMAGIVAAAAKKEKEKDGEGAVGEGEKERDVGKRSSVQALKARFEKGAGTQLKSAF